VSTPVKKLKTIALKASEKMVELWGGRKCCGYVGQEFQKTNERWPIQEEVFEKMKKAPREAEPEEEEKKDPRGTKCYECSRVGHIWADYRNLKKGKGKAYNVTLSNESEEEAPESEFFLAFVAPLVEEEDSYYSEQSDDGEEPNEAYKTLYVEYEKLREGCKQHIHDLNSLQTKKSSLLHRIQELEEKLLETQLQLESLMKSWLAYYLFRRAQLTSLVSGMYLLLLMLPLLPRLYLLSLQSQSLPPMLKIKGRTRLMEMFQTLKSPLP
jgi:hypothetical protein